jgi:hypothetical protein
MSLLFSNSPSPATMKSRSGKNSNKLYKGKKEDKQFTSGTHYTLQYIQVVKGYKFIQDCHSIWVSIESLE